MDIFVAVLGWAVFGWLALWGTAQVLSKHPDGGVRQMSRVQGLVLLAACASVLAWSIPKLWLLAAIPAGLLIPMIFMNFKVGAMRRRIEELKRESATTGIPLAELIEREKR